MAKALEMSPLSHVLGGDNFRTFEDGPGQRGLDITFSEFDNFSLPHRLKYLHMLADKNVSHAVLNNVFNVWPQEKEGAEALAACVRDLPWGWGDYIVPFLSKAIDDKRLSDTARLKVALFAIQPTDEIIRVQKRDQPVHPTPKPILPDSFATNIPRSKWQNLPRAHYKTIAEHHFGHGLVKKATKFVEKIDHELEQFQNALPLDPKLLAQAVIRAKEIDRLKFNTAIPSRNATQILKHWDELTKYAETDVSALTKCWEVASAWVKSEGDTIQRRDLEAGWYITEGVAKTSKTAFPDYDLALTIPADSQFARAVATTLNRINTGVSTPDEILKVKEFLCEMEKKDPEWFSSLITAAIKRLYIEDDGKQRNCANTYLQLFHEAIGAAIPENLTDMIDLLGRNVPSLFAGIKYGSTAGNILHFTVINIAFGDDDKISMTDFVSAIIKDKNDEFTTRHCVDGISLRSHHYLARFLGSDTPDIPLSTAENALAQLTDENNDINFRIVRDFLIALEREIFYSQTYPAESMNKLEEVTARILPWAQHAKALPLITAIYHLAYGFASEDLEHQLDEAMGFNMETATEESMDLAIVSFAEARKFLGYHFYSPGFKKIYESGVGRMNQISKRLDETTFDILPSESLEIERLKTYFKILRQIDTLKKGQLWHIFEEEDSEFVTSYRELISALENNARRIEESFAQMENRGFLETAMRYFTRLDDADQTLFLDISLDHDGRLSHYWKEFAQNLDEGNALEAASIFFVNCNVGKIAVLFHRLLILSDRETERENLLEAKELLIQHILMIQDFYEYPQLINLRDMISKLHEGLYFAKAEKEGLVNLVKIGILPPHLKWPLDQYDDMEIVVRGEFLPTETDDPRLKEPERIRRYIKRTFKRDLLPWTSNVDMDGIIAKLKAPQVAERIPIAVTRLPLLDAEAGVCEEDTFPRVELFAGEIDASEGRVGVDGNLVIQVNEAELPTVYSIPFYVTTNGIDFKNRHNSPRLPPELPFENLDTLERAILHHVDSVITAEYTARTLMKMMADLPPGTPGIGNFSSGEKIRYGPQLEALVETIGERFMIVDEAPHIWIADGKEVIITGDDWYWKNWQEVIEKKAREFNMTSQQYFAKLFEQGVKMIFIGRPVDEESYKAGIEDREVSRDPGAITGFEYDDAEITQIYMDESNWQKNKKSRLVKLPDQKRPTRANCRQARSYNYRIIVYWSIEALQGGGFRETFHRTTFHPPELTPEAKARVAAIRARRVSEI